MERPVNLGPDTYLMTDGIARRELMSGGLVSTTLSGLPPRSNMAAGTPEVPLLPWCQDLLFDADRAVVFRAREPMTVDLAGRLGVGVIEVEISAPDTADIFNPATLPVTVSKGGWIRVNATGVEDLLAVQIEQIG